MAGYIFSISQSSWDDFISNDLPKGYFTPFVPEITDEEITIRKRKKLNNVIVATFGDLITMRPGDNIYFLSNRKLYGIGKAICIGEDCKYENYEDSSAILPDYSIHPAVFLTTESTRARWVFFFAPSPYFFAHGVDMDDVLRYKPYAFKMLRAFEGLTFIKIDDEENRALKEFISLENEKYYADIDTETIAFNDSIHTRVSEIDLSNYKMDISKALINGNNRDYVLSEMFIESFCLQKLSRSETAVFDDWDYLTHQVIASPFKPLKYIDKIDGFGYRFSRHYEDSPELITKYIIIEFKKDKIRKPALEQTMQYVDWVCKEYAFGDYSKIEAYVVGSGMVRHTAEYKEEICQRQYIASTHPATPERWNNLHIVKYEFSENDIVFSEL